MDWSDNRTGCSQAIPPSQFAEFYSLNGRATQGRQQRKQRNYIVHPQQAETGTSDEPPVPQFSSSSRAKGPTPQELAQGVKDIMATFLFIQSHMAETTLEAGKFVPDQHTMQKCSRGFAQHIFMSRIGEPPNSGVTTLKPQRSAGSCTLMIQMILMLSQ